VKPVGQVPQPEGQVRAQPPSVTQAGSLQVSAGTGAAQVAPLEVIEQHAPASDSNALGTQA
jgi:hypothetical protein